MKYIQFLVDEVKWPGFTYQLRDSEETVGIDPDLTVDYILQKRMTR